MSKRPLTPDALILMLSMVPYLLRHGAVPIETVAEHFEVTPKDVYELMTSLSMSGVPGETRTYQHEDLFDFDWDLYDREGLVLLTNNVTIDRTMRFTGQEVSAVIAGLSYLSQVLPEDQAASARSALAKLAGREGVEDEAHAVLPHQELGATLQQAIAQSAPVAFTYVDAQSVTTRRSVLPTQLVFRTQRWYLEARLLNDRVERTFRLDRIRDLETIAREPSEPHADDTAPDATGEPAPTRVTLGFTQAGMAVAGWFLDPAEIPTEFPATLEADIRGIASLVRDVCGHPGALQVEAPQSVRRDVAAWARRALDQYGADAPESA